MAARYRAWAEVDLEALEDNLEQARLRAGPAEVWPVLKGNAYGHGALEVARACEAAGAPCLGVGDATEALELREGGIRCRLLVLGTVIDAEIPDLLAHGIEVGVHSESRARRIGAEARRRGRRAGVHLKIDTGMGRLGVLPRAALRVARTILEESGLVLRGLMTHCASPRGALDPRTAEQLACFEACLQELQEHGLPVPVPHAANSALLFTSPPPLAGRAVRPGLALYGLLPEGCPPDPALREVLSLRTQIVFLKDLEPGSEVGYGGTWKAARPTRLAILPLGYADGLPWRCSSAVQERENRAPWRVLVRGRPCPVVGAVSMDYTAIDVTEVPGAAVGDRVTLVGRDGAARISLAELARAAGTLPYEVSCRLGPRVRRVHLRERPAPAALP